MANRATVVRHLDRDPDGVIDEILDSSGFVAARGGVGSLNRTMERVQESSMARLWDAPEDEVKRYYE